MEPTEILLLQPASVGLVDEATGSRLPLARFPFAIGRAAECDLVLSETCVSRRHAEIAREGARCVLADNGSRYGTFVNGERVVRHVLLPGESLQFGSTKGARLRFESGSAAEASSTDMLAQLQRLDAGKSDLEKLRWFLEAARELNTAGKVERVLASLLQATLALTEVERGYVFLAKPDGELELALGRNAAGGLMDSPTLSQTVIRQAAEGVDQFLVTDTLSAEGGPVPESLMVRNIRTVICIPMRQRRAGARDGDRRYLLGVLYLDSRFHPGWYSDIDHELLRTIAREAAALVENAQLAVIEEQAQRYDRELQIAAGIQQRLMTVQIPAMPFATVEADSVACSAVGGDFFDVIPDDHTLSVVLVDVSGKGMSAAILASTLQGMLYTQLQGRRPLAEIAAATNRYLCAKNVGKYATMLLLRLHEDGLLEYINCGHIRPRVCHGDAVTRLEVANLPVGLLACAVYTAADCQLAPGSRVVLVSDGFTEAEDAHGECFGEERLDHAARCTELQHVIGQMREFCAAHPASDDCTIVQMVYKGLERAG